MSNYPIIKQLQLIKHNMNCDKKNNTLFALTLGLLSLASIFVATPKPAQAEDAKRVWTIDEVLAERAELPKPDGGEIKYCQGGRFKPCVCAPDVSRLAQYRPSLKECKKKAAIILSGRYANVFSVVVRNKDNQDRFPKQGINNCSSYQRDVLGLNKCSAYKVQKRIKISDANGSATVHCLGASGYSAFFKKVTRMTAKLADSPNDTNDPLVRWCLKSPTEALN